MTIETNMWINPSTNEHRHYTQTTLAQLIGKQADGKLWADSAGALHIDKFTSEEVSQEEALSLAIKAVKEAGGIDYFARYPFSLEDVVKEIFAHKNEEVDGKEITALKGVTSLEIWQYPEDDEDPTMDIDLRVEGCQAKQSLTVRLSRGEASVGQRIQEAAISALKKQELIDSVNR